MKTRSRFSETARTVSRVLIAGTVLVFSGLGVGVVATALANRGSRPAEPSPPAQNPFVAPGSTLPQERMRSLDSISDARRTPTVVAAARVLPSVVSLRTERTERRRDLWGRVVERTAAGLGSGFAIDAAGTIVTNAHVLQGVERIEVVGADGQLYGGELIGLDELTDIAVVRIPPEQVPPVPLGSSSDIFIGEPAVALGTPTGYSLHNTEATVTSGVISGVGRDIRRPPDEGQEQTDDAPVLYADMIQTDASINPGNSGGPLANADGEVIGVNSSIFSRSGGSEGLGFAIPIDRALLVASELLQFGRVRRPWAGLQISTDPSGLSAGLARPTIGAVDENAPASQAGLRPGDQLVALNGRAIHHDLDWEIALTDAGVGATVEVEFRRNGRPNSTQLQLEEVPSGRAARVEVLAGLRLISVTQSIQLERGLAVDYGAFVASIGGDVAEATGLREGDVILRINRFDVSAAEDAGELFEYYARQSDGWVRFSVARNTRLLLLPWFRVG